MRSSKDTFNAVDGCRRLSRRATSTPDVLSSSHRQRTEKIGADAPPIRRGEGTVPISSGSISLISEPKKGVRLRKSKTHKAPGDDSLRSANGKAGDTKGQEGTGIHVSAAGHTYDRGYDKWKNFDVEAAIRSVDQVSEGREG